MEDKLQIIKDFEKVLQSTRFGSDINIKYGSVECIYSDLTDENGNRIIRDIKFHESDRVLNQQDDPREMVRLAWGKQSDMFATYQSIEGDSGIAIISDIMKAVNKM